MDFNRSKKHDRARLFDGWAASYAEKYSDSSPKSHFFGTRLAHVCVLLDVKAGSKVLDVGCGPGMMVQPLVDRNIEFFGTDLSQEMIRACQTRTDHLDMCHLTIGRIERLPFLDSSFDAVLCMGVLEYVEDSELAIREARRVLKPNGVIIISLLNKMSPYRLVENLGLAIRRQDRPETMFTERDCRALLRANQLQIVDLLYFDFNLFLPPLDKRYPRRSVQTSRRLEFLRRSVLRWLGTALLVKAKKSTRSSSEQV